MFPESWSPGVRAAGILSIAIIAVYARAFSAPFIGEELRRIESIGNAAGNTADGPVAGFSLLLNHAISGADVRGYHAVNLFLHLTAGLFCFGILFRLGKRLAWVAPFFSALMVALLWSVHPLQTEAVVTIGHRSGLLGAWFTLLSIYAVVRGAEVDGSRTWKGVAVIACTLGMATHPVVAAVPILAMLTDRTFFAGTFREAWRRNSGTYLLMAATWCVLLVNIWNAYQTNDFLAGAEPMGFFSAWYRELMLFLKLAVWPNPLNFDYGVAGVTGSMNRWPFAPMAGLLLVGTALALWRWPRVGLVAAWIFLTLAAASVDVGQDFEPISEHHMYLPLAALVAVLVHGTLAIAGRAPRVGLVGLAALLGILGYTRLSNYHSGLELWGDSAAKAPANARAHYHLGNALLAAGRTDDAIARFQTALTISPSHVAAHSNLAAALLELGRDEEAIAHYQAVNLAGALVRLGRVPEATEHYEAATRLGTSSAVARRHLGRALAEAGRIEDALVHLEEAVRLDPTDAESRLVFGMVLSAAGRSTEALKHFTEAVLLRPKDARAHAALGDALIEEGRPAEALTHLEIALRSEPARAAILHASIADALVRLGRASEAIEHYETALRLNPDNRDARANLERIRAAAIRYNAKK
jgi:protein O-mannosyl-transferase